MLRREEVVLVLGLDTTKKYTAGTYLSETDIPELVIFLGKQGN